MGGSEDSAGVGGGGRVPLGVSDQVTETVAEGAKATQRGGLLDGQQSPRRRQPKRHLDLQWICLGSAPPTVGMGRSLSTMSPR